MAQLLTIYTRDFLQAFFGVQFESIDYRKLKVIELADAA